MSGLVPLKLIVREDFKHFISFVGVQLQIYTMKFMWLIFKFFHVSLSLSLSLSLSIYIYIYIYICVCVCVCVCVFIFILFVSVCANANICMYSNVYIHMCSQYISRCSLCTSLCRHFFFFCSSSFYLLRMSFSGSRRYWIFFLWLYYILHIFYFCFFRLNVKVT